MIDSVTASQTPESVVVPMKPAPDPVKRPAHYRIFDELVGRQQIEAIDVIECIVKHYPAEIAYHIGNDLKYLFRAPHKGDLLQDLRKSEEYKRRAINRAASLR